MAEEGRVPAPRYTAEEALRRVRERARIRSEQRRKSPSYNEEAVKRKRAWRAANRERHLRTSRAYETKQLAENIQRRLSRNLRNRIRKAMLGKTRGVSAVRDLGCTVPELRVYLESKFADGMTWENYGQWHIDHKMPLVMFDLTNIAQARMACHFTNLQPLWAIDNQRKHCKPRPETWGLCWRMAG